MRLCGADKCQAVSYIYMLADVYKQMLIVQGSKRRFACAWGSGLKNSVA